MKHVLVSFFCLLFFIGTAQTNVQQADTMETLLVDTAINFTDTAATARLLRIWPEPFYDYLQLDFLVFDCTEHGVEIKIVNSQNELVYSDIVQLCDGHENVRINTIDFFMTGLYSIQVKIDNKYVYYRTFKRTRY
jgi:hypothetical protein